MQPGFLHLSFLLHMVGALRTPPPAGPSMLTGQWLMMKPTSFVQVRHYILRQAPPTTLDPVVQHVHHASSIGIDIITSRSPNNQHTREGFIIDRRLDLHHNREVDGSSKDKNGLKN